MQVLKGNAWVQLAVLCKAVTLDQCELQHVHLQHLSYLACKKDAWG